MKTKKIAKRFFCIFLSLALVFILFAGCSNSGDTETDAPDTAGKATSVAESAAPSEAASAEVSEDEIVSIYKLDEPAVLTAFAPIYIPRTGGLIESWDEHPEWLKSYDATNIRVEMECVESSSYANQLSLMITSGDYTDFVETAGRYYSGGFDKMIEDDFAVDLSPYVNNIYAKDYIEAIEAIASMKDIYTDEKNIGCMYQISEPLVTGGVMIRQDWLDKYNLSTPKVLSDFEDILEVFKTGEGASEPFMFDTCGAPNGNHIASAFDINIYYNNVTAGNTYGYFQQNGKVKFSYLEDGFFEYVTLMNSWYNKGYIGYDFVSNENNTSNDYLSKIYSGKTGVFVFQADRIATFAPNVSDPNFDYTALPDIVLEEGQKVHFSTQYNNALNEAITVTTACEKPEYAVIWYNYFFTEAGRLCMWGTEGETFDYDAQGNKYFTDFVLNNPDYEQNVVTYAILSPKYSWETVERKLAFYSDLELIVSLNEIWTENVSGESWTLPGLMSLTADESSEYSPIFADIRTFCAENIAQFIVGDKGLDKITGFQETLKSIGIERCIEIQQDSLDRYYAR